MPRVIVYHPSKLPATYVELVRLYPPRALHDDVDYRNAQSMIDALTEVPRPTREQLDYLDTLSVLFEAYEAARPELAEPNADPIAILRHLMEEHDMSASDLGRLLGERSLGSKVLGRQRSLSKSQIKTLSTHFGVRADLFL